MARFPQVRKYTRLPAGVNSTVCTEKRSNIILNVVCAPRLTSELDCCQCATICEASTKAVHCHGVPTRAVDDFDPPRKKEGVTKEMKLILFRPFVVLLFLSG